MWNWTTTGNRSFHNQFLPSSDYSSQIYVEVMEWLHPSEIPRVEEHCLEALELLKKYRVDGVRVGWESATYTLLHSCSSNSGNWPQSHARCSRIRSGVLPPLPMSSMANAAKPMYLLWHSCGECNTICACKHDHVQYSDHELVPMHNWCNTNIKEWRAGGSLYQPVINDVQSKLKIHCPSFVPSLSYQSSVATLSSSNKTSDNHRQSRSSYVYCSWCSIVKEAWLKKKIIKSRRPWGDFADLSGLPHPAKRILQHYKSHGAPVKFKTCAWTKSQICAAIIRDPHQSCHEHFDFLKEELVDMINKEQWIILLHSVAKTLPGLRLSPPGIFPQRGRSPRWMVRCKRGYPSKRLEWMWWW